MIKNFIVLLVVCFTTSPLFLAVCYSADTNISVSINSTFIDVQNLKVSNNSTTPNTKIDVSWNNLIVGTIQTQQTSTITLDAATTGVNGLDTGSLAANTWYYLFAISTGSTTNSLLSTSSTSPTMPSGYTNKRLISTFRTDGASHFYSQKQYDHDIWYDVSSGVLKIGPNLQATSYTALDFSSFFPPQVNKVIISFIFNMTFNSTTNASIIVRPTGSSADAYFVMTFPGNGTQQMYYRSQAHVVLNNSQSLDYELSNAPATGGAELDPVGYYLPF